MSVLIVDKAGSREVLREFLGHLGIGRVLEARNAEDALDTLAALRAKIQLVILDLDLPGMDGLAMIRAVRARLGRREAPAFVLTSADLDPRQARDLKLARPRADALLSKPFRRSDLRLAMCEAMRAKSALKSALLYIGNVSEELSQIQTAVRRHRNHWTEVLHGAGAHELELAIASSPTGIGGVLVDPDVHATLPGDWLGRFLQSPKGSRAEVVALGRGAPQNGYLHRHAEIFLEITGGEAAWTRLLDGLSTRVVNAWDFERIALLAKRDLQENQRWRAAFRLCQILKKNPGNSRANAMAALTLKKLRLTGPATLFSRRAIRANPASARAHLLHLNLLADTGSVELGRAVDQALEFCPRHPQILAGAKRMRQGA